MPGLEGKTLGRYHLHNLVGRGGMADVYKGYDPHFEREVAIKVFKREDEEMLRRFIREAHLMASFHNIHLVPIYDSGESVVDGDARYYIVMPFMEGGTLRARIRRSPLSLAETCHTLRDIADALDYIHSQGIVHRDIKSSNVLLDAEGRCFLADFGIARTTSDATQLTTTGSVLGTVDYVAPELFEGNQKANALSDLYSLGVLLFEMVTGQLPFSAESQLAVVTMHMTKPPPSPRSISPNISLQVEHVIFKALEKKPEQRYASATALADAFCRAVAATRNQTGVQDLDDSSTRQPPEVHVAPHRIILPPVIPMPPVPAVPAQWPAVQPSALGNATEITPFVPPYPAAPVPATPAVTALPRESKRTPPPSRSGRSRRSLSRTTIAVIIALIVLLVVIIPSVYIFVTNMNNTNNTGNLSSTTATQSQQNSATGGTTSTLAPTATPNATATAQAIAAATATAQAQATAAAIAHMTATAQAQASATAGVIQTATAGKPDYKDALNDPTNPATLAAQWDQNNQCVFQQDGYHVMEGVNLVNFHGCREVAHTYKNATLSVDMTINSGHTGGLFFRLSTDIFNNYAGYLFEVDSKGNYKISTVSGSNTTPLPGHDWTQTTALKQGDKVKNTLQVIMSGNTFLFYANGTFLTLVTDTTFSSEGEIAFLASTAGSNADIVYSNLAVYPRP